MEGHRDEDEDAKRFDLILLRLQLARLESDALTYERLRKPPENSRSSSSPKASRMNRT